MRKFNNNTRIVLIVLIIIGILAIGYAALGANLKINGIAEQKYQQLVGVYSLKQEVLM